MSDGVAEEFDEECADVRTGLYRLYDADDNLLYIGISDDPHGRMRGHAGDKSWWGEVARKTLVWYPHRTQAETAETIAIGLEQPRHNKAKRYMRLPEQPFPVTEARPAAPRRLAVAKPRAEAGDGEYHEYGWADARREGREWPSDLPIEWPADMWCRVWWRNEVAFRDMVSMSCPAGDQIERRRYAAIHQDYPGSRMGDGWARPDNPRMFHGGSRYERPWSAHCLSNGPLAAHCGEIQRRFLYALLTARRCAAIQLGQYAWAAGFAGKDEAQAAGEVLVNLAWGHVTGPELAIAAIRAARPGSTMFGCPGCTMTRKDDANRAPLCPRCRAVMVTLVSAAEMCDLLPAGDIRSVERLTRQDGFPAPFPALIPVPYRQTSDRERAWVLREVEAWAKTHGREVAVADDPR